MSAQRKSRILVISDQSIDFLFPDFWDVSEVVYSFSDEESPDGFSAWEKDSSSFFVSASCKPLAGGFFLQALNRPLLQLAMKQKIDGILLVGLYGCTIDLPRVFSFLNIPVAWALQPGLIDLGGAIDRFTLPWLKDAFSQVTHVLKASESFDVPFEQSFLIDQSDFIEQFSVTLGLYSERPSESAYDYSLYEFGLRDHPLLCAIQSVDVKHFSECNQVLDLGCGSGIFLSLLEQKGIAACGVERNNLIAAYARGMGLNVITDDAVRFAEATDSRFDGIYCSHFVEHLPVELVEKLLKSLARIVDDNGTVVLTFPDPESIRSQLLGFWRDPEHVRFYHPELISSLANSVGLDLVWSSYDEQPHNVIPFSRKPGSLPEFIPAHEISSSTSHATKDFSLFSRLLRRLVPGLYKSIGDIQQRMDAQEAVIQHQYAVIQQLAARTETLWDINQTWAWNDNVTLKFKRRTR